MQLTGNLSLKKPEGTDVVNIDDLNQNMDILDVEVTKLATPSQNGRMSAADKAKLDGIEAGAQRNTVTSVNNKTGAVTLTASDVGASPTGHTHTFAEITSKPTTLSGYGITDAIPASQKGSANGVASLDGSAKVPTTQLPPASTTQAGIVQLNDTLTSTSTTQAATANAVKQVNDAVVVHSADTAAHGIGNKSNLLTSTKNTIVDAINELFTSVSNGKTLLETTIAGKNVIVSKAGSVATFAELNNAIQQLRPPIKITTLYDSGNEYTSITGGFIKYNPDSSYPNGYFRKFSDSIACGDDLLDSYDVSGWRTQNPIDLTKVNTIYFRTSASTIKYRSGYNVYQRYIIASQDNYNLIGNSSSAASVSVIASTALIDLNIDVRNLTGFYYIYCFPFSRSYPDDTLIQFTYKVWMEGE